jgi:hypothetical protein
MRASSRFVHGLRFGLLNRSCAVQRLVGLARDSLDGGEGRRKATTTVTRECHP